MHRQHSSQQGHGGRLNDPPDFYLLLIAQFGFEMVRDEKLEGYQDRGFADAISLDHGYAICLKRLRP